LHVFGYVLTRILGQYIPKWPVYCEFAYAQHVLVCIEVVGIVYARIDTNSTCIYILILVHTCARTYAALYLHSARPDERVRRCCDS